MAWKRAYTLQEEKLMDSKWMFEHPGGNFPVEFRADSMNSCASAARKSHRKISHALALPGLSAL